MSAIPLPGGSDRAPHAPREAGTGTPGSPSSVARARRAVRIPALRSGLRGAVLGGCSIAGALGLWHLASTTGLDLILSWQNVPPPHAVLGQMLALLQTQEFFVHIGVSLERILISYLLAATVGIAIGVAMGSSRTIRQLLAPHIELLRPIPAVAWIPLAILMAPSEESSILFITFLGAFFPIVLNTVHGVEQTPEVLIRAGQCMGASRMAIFLHVVIPAALPGITTGLAIGMGVAWFSLLAGEIISGQYGIGYFTWDAYSLVEYPNIIIGMIVIGGLGLLSTALVRMGTRPFLRWQPRS